MAGGCHRRWFGVLFAEHTLWIAIRIFTYRPLLAILILHIGPSSGPEARLRPANGGGRRRMVGLCDCEMAPLQSPAACSPNHRRIQHAHDGTSAPDLRIPASIRRARCCGSTRRPRSPSTPPKLPFWPPGREMGGASAAADLDQLAVGLPCRMCAHRRKHAAAASACACVEHHEEEKRGKEIKGED